MVHELYVFVLFIVKVLYRYIAYKSKISIYCRWIIVSVSVFNFSICGFGWVDRALREPQLSQSEPYAFLDMLIRCSHNLF